MKARGRLDEDGALVRQNGRHPAGEAGDFGGARTCCR
jgi:hypothetical protein